MHGIIADVDRHVNEAMMRMVLVILCDRSSGADDNDEDDEINEWCQSLMVASIAMFSRCRLLIDGRLHVIHLDHHRVDLFSHRHYLVEHIRDSNVEQRGQCLDIDHSALDAMEIGSNIVVMLLGHCRWQ